MTEVAEHIGFSKIDEFLFSPEGLLSIFIGLDGWQVELSDRFPHGLKVIKPRRNGTAMSVHLVDGKFAKIAENPELNPTIEKEALCWNTVLKEFEIDESVSVNTIRVPKPKNERSFYPLKYITMPYMGIPIRFLNQIVPGIVDKPAQDEFVEKMTNLLKKGFYHTDLNPANILGRVENGKIALYPIDFELAKMNVSPEHRDDHLVHLINKCNKSFSQSNG